MFISAPIPHLALPLIKYLEDEKDIEFCFNYFENISTTELETGSRNFNDKLDRFIKRLAYEKPLATYTASFITYYFDIKEQSDIADMYKKVVKNTGNFSNISDHDSGLLQGLFTVCLLNDVKAGSKKKIPDNVKQAIKYIESENFIVHLEEKNE